MKFKASILNKFFNYNIFSQVTPEVHTMGKFLVEVMLYDHAFLAHTPTHRAATAYYTTLQLITSQNWVGRKEIHVHVCPHPLAEVCFRMYVHTDCTIHFRHAIM